MYLWWSLCTLLLPWYNRCDGIGVKKQSIYLPCTVYLQVGMCRVTVDDSGLCCVHVTSFPPLIISFCFFPALNNPLCLFINYSVHSAQQLNESLSSFFSSVISCSLTDLSSKHPRSWNTLILVKQRQFQQTVANFPVLLRICLPTAPLSTLPEPP